MSMRAAFGLQFRFPRRGRGFWFSLAIDVIWPFTALFTRMRMTGLEHLRHEKGVLVASNHLSFADPVSVTSFCLAGGRIPRYLAKASLWRIPIVGKVLASGGHIPVTRGTAEARNAYHGAVEAAARGECVVFFPEATFSDDDGHWPSPKVKNGVARVALESGLPVIPLANWGTHLLLPSKARFPKLFPRKTIELVAGPPVDLSDLIGQPINRATLDVATARIMRAVTDLLADIRQEPAPELP